MTLAGHWNQIYESKPAEDVSWFQADPAVSLELIHSTGVALTDPVVDIGGGASRLADVLLGRGFRDVTVLDISREALAISRARLGRLADTAAWVCTDLRAWVPQRQYNLWHDRAVFHFLTDPAERKRYRRHAAATIRPGGSIILGTFAADGPRTCSGLPVNRYTAPDLEEEFTPEFLPVHSRREEHHMPGGSCQPFTWVVLQRRDT